MSILCQVLHIKNLTYKLFSSTLSSVRTKSNNSVAGKVRTRIRRGGPGALWTYSYFRELPPLAVAAALSRLAKEGTIRRIRKGVYYSPRKTRFGELAPEATSVAGAVLKGKRMDWKASGLPAYNGLGLTTQVSPAVTLDVPKRIYSLRTGTGAEVHLKTRATVSGVSAEERVSLDALRDLRRIPNTTPAEVLSKVTDLFRTGRLSFDRVARHSLDEPPRVRAILGAIGSEIGANPRDLDRLRKSLNPVTTFHVGLGESLPRAREWRIR